MEWDNRKELGTKMMELIESLIDDAKSQDSLPTKQKICHTISYMAQTLNSLISSENEITKRLEELEKIAGIVHKSKWK